MNDPPYLPAFDNFDPAVAETMRSALPMTGIPEYLGIQVVDVAPGTMTAQLVVRPELMNPFGSAHGGTLAALVDHLLGAVLYPHIPPGAWAATTELKLNFISPVRNGVLRARAQIISMTQRTAVVRVDATSGGRLVGAAQGTVTILPPKGGPSVPPPERS